MAEQLIDKFAGAFEPEKYKDTYRDSLCAIIRAKRAGKEVHRAPETEEAAPPDLLEALRASIEAGRGKPGEAARRATATTEISPGSRRLTLSGGRATRRSPAARRCRRTS